MFNNYLPIFSKCLPLLKQYLSRPDQYLSNSYRLGILRQASAWIGNGIEIHNPLNSAEILHPNKKAAR